MSEKKRILIVDDSSYMRLTLRKMLEVNGFEVVGEAADGEDALVIAQSLKPDLITMDLSMKNIGGIEATKEIKAAMPSAKILAISALAESRFVKAAIAAGAHDFVVKPFTQERLMSAVRTALGLEANTAEVH